MGRKKCPLCLSCYTVFWYNNQRYYSCWLCQKIVTGRDDELIEVEDPRIKNNVTIEEKDQEDDTIHNATSE
jgi:hypothetical protein